MTKSQTERKTLACVVGCGVMLLLSAVMVLLIPVFILNEYLPAEYTTTFVIISMGIIAFIGSITACSLTRNRMWETGVFAVAAYYILLIFTTVFFFDGLNVHVVYRVAAGAFGCAAALLVLMLQKKSHVKRKKRRGNR